MSSHFSPHFSPPFENLKVTSLTALPFYIYFEEYVATAYLSLVGVAEVVFVGRK
jgi:hypothetical protein